MWQYFKYTWFFLIWIATVFLIFKFFTASYLKGRHSAQRGEFLIVFQPCSVSPIETLKCQWPRHTCKTKVSRERSKAEIPSRPSCRIYSAPCSGRVQMCNKVYESTVRPDGRIAVREEKRWESGKPESSEWRGVSFSPTAVTPEMRGIQAANCNPNKQLLS